MRIIITFSSGAKLTYRGLSLGEAIKRLRQSSLVATQAHNIGHPVSIVRKP